jgi:bifunctional DNA-binding transcriptional regulator/antitoxin component of YhaV-PrlF toxin-antitoxin module
MIVWIEHPGIAGRRGEKEQLIEPDNPTLAVLGTLDDVAARRFRRFRGCIDRKRCLHYSFSMTAHIYGRGQMVIPARARKEAQIGQGDVVLVQPEGNGRIVLIRLEKPKPRRAPKVKITFRKGTHAVGSTGRTISSQQVRAALEDFP